MFYPKLRRNTRSRRVNQTFLGYDRSPRPKAGALVEMENLTAEHFPTLSPRAPRGMVATLTSPQGMMGKETLVWVDGNSLFIGGLEVSGPALSTLEDMCPKTLVSMGAYILIFPDKVYVNTADLSDWGYLENIRAVTCNADSGVRYSLCQSDGTAYASVLTAATAPEAPESGSHWLDTALSPPVLKVYSADSGMWSEVSAVCVKLEGANLGAGFAVYDGVTLSGCGEKRLNGSAILQAVGTDYVVVSGVISGPFTQTAGTVTIARTVPDMDFLTQCGNRLWGCKYGLVDGEAVNEIYACALGDFKNWQKFQGLSTDSYVATRGSDGPWTGAATHLGCPVFFKENVLEKVYPSSSGAHEIVTTACRGVRAGSHRSLAIVGEVLYYHSATDICAYDGALPVSVSQDLGQERYSGAVAGSMGSKYYISMADSNGIYQLFVYDTARNLWHREDNLEIRHFATIGHQLYGLDASGRILSMDGSQGESEGKVSWSAESGPIGLERMDQQMTSRLAIRLKPEAGSDVDVYIRYDGEGEWIHGANLRGDGLGSRVIPLLPRRCEYYNLRLRGRGPCLVYGVSAVQEEGSDVQWPCN